MLSKAKASVVKTQARWSQARWVLARPRTALPTAALLLILCLIVLVRKNEPLKNTVPHFAVKAVSRDPGMAPCNQEVCKPATYTLLATDERREPELGAQRALFEEEHRELERYLNS